MRMFAILLLALTAPAAAATIPITPESYVAALAAAQPGDVLAAAPGTYPAAKLANKVFAPPVTLRGPEAAVFGRLTLTAVDGFATVGATFAGDPLYGIVLDHVRNVTLDRPLFVGLHAGVNLVASTAVTITNFECRAMASDCLDVEASQNIRVLGGLCHGGVPVPGAHPDCVQMRGLIGLPPLSNIEVANVWCVGRTQCIDRFGDQLGASAIAVHDIVGDVDLPAFVNLIAAAPCVDCRLTGIHPAASRGAAFIANVQPRAPSATWTGTIADVTISARPVALPQ